MKASIYQTADDVYLAVLSSGQQIMRGSLVDLAVVLRAKGILAAHLLFGDWRADAQLLKDTQQKELVELML